jgi:hypothetical protein
MSSRQKKIIREKKNSTKGHANITEHICEKLNCSIIDIGSFFHELSDNDNDCDNIPTNMSYKEHNILW